MSRLIYKIQSMTLASVSFVLLPILFVFSDCILDEENFSLLCPKHKVYNSTPFHLRSNKFFHPHTWAGLAQT